MKDFKDTSIFDCDNIMTAIKEFEGNVVGILQGGNDSIQNNITKALEGILIARKEALSKVDNKPENIAYSIEAKSLDQLFKFAVGILEECGYEPISPLIAADWQDKYGITIVLYDSGGTSTDND